MPVADLARCGADAAGEVVELHARPAADRSFGDLLAECGERSDHVLGDDGARVGEVAVVGLAHHRDHDVLRAAARGHDRRLVDGPEGVGPAEIHGRLHPTRLVDLEL